MKQITDKDKHFMREAIRLADESVLRGGGPFGAVIVKDGEIIAGSSNSVTIDQEPTAHAEVNTIREACRKLGTFDLTGCTIYTSCEPCPMCLGAIYWARISRIFYGNTRKDARDIDFADDFIYEELDKPLAKRTVPIIPLLRDEALRTFRLVIAQTRGKIVHHCKIGCGDLRRHAGKITFDLPVTDGGALRGRRHFDLDGAGRFFKTGGPQHVTSRGY